MVKTDLDRPEPTRVKCAICDQMLVANHYWLFGKWLHATVHEKCLQDWEKNVGHRKVNPQEIPPRFAEFDPTKVDRRVLAACGGFSPESNLKTLAIIGERATGKSRLMWATIQSFFGELERLTGMLAWVDYYLFTDLITEFDRNALVRVKAGRYVAIDDIGCTDSFGRERAQLQDVIRTRVQKGMWTFLTIDNPEFDAGFNDLFRDRALTVYTGDD
jgi:hypothetical protein